MEPLELQTAPNPDASVIWLHGLGADGHDFEPVVPELHLPARLSLRFVFPHAPVQPVTINLGMAMRAWFDIFEPGAGQDEAGIRASQAIVEELIERECARGIDAARIVLAGFSQGGAIALQTGLRCARPLAGIIALSCWLPLDSTLASERSAANESVPLFMAHGMNDELVDIERARQSRDRLRAHGYAPEWHEYPMGHAVCQAELLDIGAWLAARL